MTQQELYERLNYVNHSSEKRTYYAQTIIDNSTLFSLALEIWFMIDNTRSNKAGWLCESVCKQDLTILYPHLNFFIKNMGYVYQDSALRPVSKIT